MQAVDLQPAVDRVVPSIKEQVCSLGVCQLCESTAFPGCLRGICGLTGAFVQLRLNLNQADLAMVVHTLVTSSLNYSNALYMRLPLKMVQKLQLVQNAVVYLVTRVWHTLSGMPLLQWPFLSEPNSRCWGLPLKHYTAEN